MGALASKLEQAHRTQEMSATIQKSVPLLQGAMKQMNAAGVSSLIILIDLFLGHGLC